MAVFNGGIVGVSAPAASSGASIPLVVEFAAVGMAPPKIGDIISGRVEAADGLYRIRFAFHGVTFEQPLRGGHILPGNAAFTIVAEHANGFYLRPLPAGEADFGSNGAIRGEGPAAGTAPQVVGATRPYNMRTDLPIVQAAARPPRLGAPGNRSSAEVLTLTNSGSQIWPPRVAGSSAAQTDPLRQLQRDEGGAASAALPREEPPAVSVLNTRVNTGPALPGGVSRPTIINSANTDKTMSGIDLQSLAPRAGPVVTDFSAVRIEVAQAKDMGLKAGEVVHGVVERDGEGLRFSFDLSGQSVSIPLQGRELPTGKTVLTLSSVEPGKGWLRPASIAPAPVDNGATQYINESMTAASLLLRPQNAEALARFLAPANLSRLLADPEFAEHLVPLLKNRLKSDRFGPAEVKSAFESCGIWAEGLLAQGKPLRKNDVKSALLRILNANRESLADLARLDQFSAALGSIESAQVQAAQAQIKGELLFNFFIPFADANPVKVSVSRAAPSELQSAPPLVVNLYTKNDSLGELWLNTQIEKNADIEIVMWAIESKVVSAASAASRRLLDHFREFGLQLKKISIINGARPETDALSAASGQLVNLQI